MNIYIEQSDGAYRALFKSLGYVLCDSPETADVIVFTGGSDVHPKLYHDRAHIRTYADLFRDEREMKLFQFAKQNGKPMIGICRGAQFLNVMNGGRMYQHVQKHCQSHHITDLITGETIYVTSTHHQMMMPMLERGVLVAVSYLGGEREWYDGQIEMRDVSNQDNEVVWYSNTKCLCFQPHPEMGQGAVEYAEMRRYFQQLIHRYIA